MGEYYVEKTDVVYGDTDSGFFKYTIRDKTSNGRILKGKEALKASIAISFDVEKNIKKTLKYPHHLEYEKTFHPFILFSKKRYVGNKYEFDPDKYKQTSMGIVLKRRDNADIVKLVYGGIIDIIMNEKNIAKSIDFLQQSLRKLIDGCFPIELLVVTKSLKPTYAYKNPHQIAHWVLSNRMGERDPGNRPQANDRIPYVYIVKKAMRRQKILQGDRIENPDYVIENKIPIDFSFYITNQIMKPVSQIYDLIDDIASEDLFREILRIAENRSFGRREITEWM